MSTWLRARAWGLLGYLAIVALVIGGLGWVTAAALRQYPAGELLNRFPDLSEAPAIAIDSQQRVEQQQAAGQPGNPGPQFPLPPNDNSDAANRYRQQVVTKGEARGGANTTNSLN